MIVRPLNDNLAVSPDDTANLMPYTTKGLLTSAIYVGSVGDVTVVNENGTTALFKAVPAGTTLWVAAKRINAVGTTALNLVACYWV